MKPKRFPKRETHYKFFWRKSGNLSMKHSSPMCMMANGIEKEESKKENGNGNLKRSHAWINALYSHLMQKNSSFSSVCLLWRSALFVLRSNFSPAAPRLGTVCACRTNTAELSAWICCISKNHSVANYRYSHRNHIMYGKLYKCFKNKTKNFLS